MGTLRNHKFRVIGVASVGTVIAAALIFATTSGPSVAKGSGAKKKPATSAAAVTPTTVSTCEQAPRKLGEGITHERIEIIGAPAIVTADDCIDIVRFDPTTHKLRLLTATREPDVKTLPEWVEQHHLSGAVNAGMFHDDLSSVGMLVSGDVRNNEKSNPKFGGYFAWDAIAPTSVKTAGKTTAKVNSIDVFGKGCKGFQVEQLTKEYRSISQSYRLIGCDGEALPWKDPKAYSIAGIGVDRNGWIVTMHARSPHKPVDISATLGQPAVNLRGMIFVEGGPEASMIARGDDKLAVSRVGSYETGFVENDDNHVFWKLPLVIGIERVSQAK
jgi:uncharacterized protein YigE (DUF2233 family)